MAPDQHHEVSLNSKKYLRAFRSLPRMSETKLKAAGQRMDVNNCPNHLKQSQVNLTHYVTFLRLSWVWLVTSGRSAFGPVGEFSKLFATLSSDEIWWKDKGAAWFDEVGFDLLRFPTAQEQYLISCTQKFVSELYPEDQAEMLNKFEKRLNASSANQSRAHLQVAAATQLLTDQILFHISADLQTGLQLKGIEAGSSWKVASALKASRRRLRNKRIQPFLESLDSYREWPKTFSTLCRRIRIAKVTGRTVPIVLLDDRAYEPTTRGLYFGDEKSKSLVLRPREQVNEPLHELVRDLNYEFISKQVPVIHFLQDRQYTWPWGDCDTNCWKVLSSPFPAEETQTLAGIHFPRAELDPPECELRKSS